MNFDPAVFGRSFHHFVQHEYALFGIPFGVSLHIATLILLLLVFRYGNRYRKLFSIYFAGNWLFLFGYWGIYASIYWYKIGAPYLLVYAATPVLLGLIVYRWIQEIVRPSIDLDFRDVRRYRWVALLFLAWGFWYPDYVYGQGFNFNAGDLLYSYYGLMPCPTSMVVLSLFTLKFPGGNKHLYALMTVYALLIGTATVLSGWLPDLPFVALGIWALFLAVRSKSTYPVSLKKSI